MDALVASSTNLVKFVVVPSSVATKKSLKILVWTIDRLVEDVPTQRSSAFHVLLLSFESASGRPLLEVCRLVVTQGSQLSQLSR